MKIVKLPYIFWHLITNFTHYCLTLLGGVVLIWDAVGIILKKIRLQIAQQSRRTLRNAIVAQRSYVWGQQLWDKAAPEVSQQSQILTNDLGVLYNCKCINSNLL
ncbi:hypothetical protein A6770_32505 [Nostoc minutum NIES-26]|uniref:Uncharacterized protein n=1 Tax=Nostoc minutum NIES-26 TaxID=1844469 RepID=A0A367Q439_9NOSO|nr:hypothetical protein A6770_32505 [Nostoc minutum NIES-26]